MTLEEWYLQEPILDICVYAKHFTKCLTRIAYLTLENFSQIVILCPYGRFQGWNVIPQIIYSSSSHLSCKAQLSLGLSLACCFLVGLGHCCTTPRILPDHKRQDRTAVPFSCPLSCHYFLSFCRSSKFIKAQNNEP